jgi:hypothetical protein
MNRPALRPGIRVLLALVLTLVATSPVVAQEAGSETGEVVFRVTLSGPVDADDTFVIWSRCPDEWCDVTVNAGGPTERPVIACGGSTSHTPACTADTYEWTVQLVPGTLEYRFERAPGGRLNSGRPSQVLHSGTWDVHPGRQVLTFAYGYPSSSAEGPVLPDTAMSAP